MLSCSLVNIVYLNFYKALDDALTSSKSWQIPVAGSCGRRTPCIHCFWACTPREQNQVWQLILGGEYFCQTVAGWPVAAVQSGLLTKLLWSMLIVFDICRLDQGLLTAGADGTRLDMVALIYLYKIVDNPVLWFPWLLEITRGVSAKNLPVKIYHPRGDISLEGRPEGTVDSKTFLWFGLKW